MPPPNPAGRRSPAGFPLFSIRPQAQSSIVSDPLPHALSRPRAAGAAWAMGAMIVLALLHGTRLLPAWPAGIAAWVADALLWPRLDRRQKRFALGLGALGALVLGGALWRGQAPQWTRLLTQNTALLGMLGAVSFLQLVGLGAGADDLPRGARARWLPLALSAVVIAGHVWLPHWHSLGIISAAALAL